MQWQCELGWQQESHFSSTHEQFLFIAAMSPDTLSREFYQLCLTGKMERKDIITSQLLFTHSPQVNLLNVCKWNNGITENCNCFVHVLEIGSSATTMEGISPSLFLKSRIVKKVMDTIMSLVLWVFYSLNKAFVSLLINGLSLHNWLPLLVQWNF